MTTSISRRNLLSGAAAALGAGASPPAERPNVIFFFPDQVRSNELGYNGGQNVPTPHIDRFSTQGVTVAHAVSSCPLCTPYRAMLQTGRWPTLSGGVMNWVNLPSSGHGLGDVFSRGGYDTAYIGKWHLAAGRYAGTLDKHKEVQPAAESVFVPP